MTLDELRKKFGVGLTGGLATGKSTVAKILRGLGHPVLDADQLSRQATSPRSEALQTIREEFGSEFIGTDGQLLRSSLAKFAFAEPSRVARLEGILHKQIAKLQDQELLSLGLLERPRLWFYEASLLFETGSWRLYREIWVCHCSREEQIRRATALRGLDAAVVESMMERQWPMKKKLEQADRAIQTEMDLSELQQQVALTVAELQRIL